MEIKVSSKDCGFVGVRGQGKGKWYVEVVEWEDMVASRVMRVKGCEVERVDEVL